MLLPHPTGLALHANCACYATDSRTDRSRYWKNWLKYFQQVRLPEIQKSLKAGNLVISLIPLSALLAHGSLMLSLISGQLAIVFHELPKAEAEFSTTPLIVRKSSVWMLLKLPQRPYVRKKTHTQYKLTTNFQIIKNKTCSPIPFKKQTSFLSRSFNIHTRLLMSCF